MKTPTRKTNKEQNYGCGAPLVAQMPFIFGVCPSSFQEISSSLFLWEGIVLQLNPSGVNIGGQSQATRSSLYL